MPWSRLETTLLRRIGRRVREARNRMGLTARDAAARSDLSVRFYSELEAGRANIAVARLARVAVALRVPLHELVADEPMPQRALVALLGLRGAGKSTVGPRLAAALGMEFVELDDLIEDEAGLNLAEIFQIHGEHYYRQAEQRVLNALVADSDPRVVALSGGIVQNEPAFEVARRHCTTLWLKATPEQHMLRVLEQGDDRPVHGRENAMAELRALLEKREPLYALADIAVDTASVSVAGAVGKALQALEQEGVAVC